MSKPRLLDMYCKAGGAGMGYHRAGFEVVGVDIEPQKHYPFEFHQADAIEYAEKHQDEFDAFHASPPCQEYSRAKGLKTKEYPKLIEPTRYLFIKIGKPWVIENVPGAPLLNPLVLCGTMFGLRVIRHRLFETSLNIQFAPFCCNHWGKFQPNLIRGRRKLSSLDGYSFICVFGEGFNVKDARFAMGIDWMTGAELAEAIPPAYTEYISRFLLLDIRLHNSLVSSETAPGGTINVFNSMSIEDYRFLNAHPLSSVTQE
jgi:DNA (cytosine-5)-methyltransferase 1